MLAACKTDKGLNCFQAAGDIVQEQMQVAPFTKIIVWERVQLILVEGPIQKVVVETGSHLLNDVVLEVSENTLNIYNYNGCNLFREYGITKVYVTQPNLTELRNSSGLEIRSEGQLQYNALTLLSEDADKPDGFHKSGDFYLSLDVNSLKIISNGLSNFFLDGSAQEAQFLLQEGDSRIEAANFMVDSLYIFHRSTNKMIVNPRQVIQGEIRSIGDVISKHRPPVVNVQQFFSGQLLFED